MLSFTNPLIDLQSSVWNLGIMVPQKIAEAFLSINDKRVVCVLNNALKIHVALLPKGDNTYFFNVNKETQKELKLVTGSIVKVSMETDNTKYGMQAPEEFLELLVQDPEGRHYFESLSKGKQRNLLHQVLTIKSSLKRAEKSILILEYLKDVKGKLNFRSLNEAYKNSRF